MLKLRQQLLSSQVYKDFYIPIKISGTNEARGMKFDIDKVLIHIKQNPYWNAVTTLVRLKYTKFGIQLSRSRELMKLELWNFEEMLSKCI